MECEERKRIYAAVRNFGFFVEKDVKPLLGFQTEYGSNQERCVDRRSSRVGNIALLNLYHEICVICSLSINKIGFKLEYLL